MSLITAMCRQYVILFPDLEVWRLFSPSDNRSDPGSTGSLTA